MQRKVKETMEKAFWDSVMESMKLEEPDYSCISNLMREVRDELYQMVPDSWKIEITESIDLDLLSQVCLNLFWSCIKMCGSHFLPLLAVA